MVLQYKKFICAEESSRQCGKTVSFINGKKLNYPKGQRGIGRKENHKVLKWFLFPSPSSLSKGKRLHSHSVRVLGKPAGVCVLRGRHAWSSVFPNKKLRVCQEHENNSRLNAMLQLVVRRITWHGTDALSIMAILLYSATSKLPFFCAISLPSSGLY